MLKSNFYNIHIIYFNNFDIEALDGRFEQCRFNILLGQKLCEDSERVLPGWVNSRNKIDCDRNPKGVVQVQQSVLISFRSQLRLCLSGCSTASEKFSDAIEFSSSSQSDLSLLSLIELNFCKSVYSKPAVLENRIHAGR